MQGLPHDHHTNDSQSELLKLELEKTERFQMVSEVFRQLGDVTRLRIFWLLCHCEECVVNISAMLDMSSPAVSHHLRPLKMSGLIVSRRDGKEVYYRAADTEESRLLHRMMEQTMQIVCPDEPEHTDAEDSQTQIARQVHRWLLEHLDQKITIEELSRRFLVNPTTLKAAFKEVYGTSLAAHIKEHRMAEAARLLRQTDRSVAQIALAVGYSSQSRFSESFKEAYGMLPKDYRRNDSRDLFEKNGTKDW